MKCISWFLVLLTLFVYSSSADQQYYDPSDCYSEASYPGSKYTCNISSQTACKTFLVYRANQHFQTVSKISGLFNVRSDAVLKLNNLTSSFEVLQPGREVLVPITCSCRGQFFQANFSYTVSAENTSYSEIACEDFEGLLKLLSLTEENPSRGNHTVTTGSKLQVPLRCACLDNFTTTSNKVKYLVTYPIVEGDETIRLSKKFDISPEELWEVNHLEPSPTVFPRTTILLPLEDIPPVINFNFPAGSPPPTPGFLPTIPVEKARKNTKLTRNIYIAGCVVGFSLLLVALLSCGLLVKALKKWKVEKYQCSTPRGSPMSCSSPRSSPRLQTGTGSSPNSCLSPDLLVGIKFSLLNYSIEKIKKATRDFSEENKISSEVYEGLMDSDKVMIKRLRFEDTRQVIDVHSRINHINIVKLQGVCYGENDFSWSYLVFDFPGNCLRNYLSDPPDDHPLSWGKRAKIAFDIATGLHYLHRYTFPSYAHMRVNTRNIFVTANCRAKLGNIGATLMVRSSSSGGTYNKSKSVRGWIAPEFLLHSSASEKVDIFAFGVVLLELLSGREDSDGKLFKESIRFLGGGDSEGGCFEQLKSFMDPKLKEDYSLAEALCLAVLAKACVEDDPLHRPSMDDIVKVIARMV